MSSHNDIELRDLNKDNRNWLLKLVDNSKMVNLNDIGIANSRWPYRNVRDSTEREKVFALFRKMAARLGALDRRLSVEGIPGLEDGVRVSTYSLDASELFDMRTEEHRGYAKANAPRLTFCALGLP